MIIAVLVVLGLCLGSFVNALVWRVYKQAKSPKKNQEQLSVLRGRSICPHCKHQLKTLDLVPVISWLALRGKCRYCKKPISVQYPLVELMTTGLFVASYEFWPKLLKVSALACPQPHLFRGASWQDDLLFGLWLVLLTGLIALLVYDLRWFLLPNRIIYPLAGVALVMAVLSILSDSRPLHAFLDVVLAVVIGGGIFYVLFQASKGRWIGGGDVKLGWLLGLVVGTPGKAILFIFIASVLGTLVSLPLLATNRLKRSSTIPFGPFLIVGAVVAQFFGEAVIRWYTHSFIGL